MAAPLPRQSWEQGRPAGPDLRAGRREGRSLAAAIPEGLAQSYAEVREGIDSWLWRQTIEDQNPPHTEQTLI